MIPGYWHKVPNLTPLMRGGIQNLFALRLKPVVFSEIFLPSAAFHDLYINFMFNVTYFLTSFLNHVFLALVEPINPPTKPQATNHLVLPW